MIFDSFLFLHLLALICWFAGLFYLPRLFVYHAMAEDFKMRNQFLIMERKLYLYIMSPAMILTLISGYTLMELKYSSPYPLWLHAKLILVILLLIFHILCGYFFYQFKNSQPTPSHRFFRFFNEIPSVLLILILICVIFQP